jgi:phosphomannomutase
VDVDLIRQRKFKVVVDAINSSGAIAMPRLLDKLGVSYVVLNQEVTGDFAHNPEPLPQHLTALCESVVMENADLGIALDPDVDRLAFVCEDGSWFGEEYTIVAASDLVLRHNPGPVVSNLSSSRALGDLAKKYGQPFYQSAVGEVHVVEMMKNVNAVIGGEGNGGVILPDLHYGRDALIGVALVLTLLAKENLSLSVLRKKYPDYYMSKQKVNMQSAEDWTRILSLIRTEFKENAQSEVDGLKISFEDGWFHLRKSNTEPIIRIYTEKPTQEAADALANMVQDKISAALIMKN